MARECEFCGKRTQVGNQYTRRGLAKAKGGVGKKITGKSKRKFHPNLQIVRGVVDGTVRRVRICTRCIKSGKLQKPVRRERYAVTAPVESPAPAEAEAS